MSLSLRTHSLRFSEVLGGQEVKAADYMFEGAFAVRSERQSWAGSPGGHALAPSLLRWTHRTAALPTASENDSLGKLGRELTGVMLRIHYESL